jgi:hypothetical protein
MLRSKFLVVLLALFPLSAFAQNMQWGSGQWGGSQGCGYQQQTAQGAVSEDDPLQEMLSEIQEIKTQLKEKKSELKKIDRLSQRSHEKLDESLSPEAATMVFSHIENNARCSEYQGLANAAPAGSVGGSQGDVPVAAAQDNMLEVQGISVADWSKHCDRTKPGSVRESICSMTAAPGEGSRRADPSSCRKSLVEYRKNYASSKKLATEIEGLQDTLDARKRDLTDLKKDLREEARDATTQGDYCAECEKRGNGYTYQQPQTNWGGVLANVGTGLLASYMGYKSNKMISENNAELGFPTYNSNYSALGYGMPYFQAGLYGALSGGQGQGGFGCGGNSNQAGGAFGYPNGMMGGSMGGGMYMGNPMMMGMNGMNGMGSGMMNGGMMMSGMGMMSNGMMSSGMMMSGGLGMMTGMGMMSSGMMNGMMSSGMMMNNGMMMSGNLGMMTGMGMMIGYGSMMDSSSQALQQQMLQMQMQYQQQQSSKYSTMTSLQSELYSLMARIQQVQYGGSNFLGTGIGSNYNNYSSYNNGVLPAPSSYSYGSVSSSGVLPAPGTTGTSTYYGR